MRYVLPAVLALCACSGSQGTVAPGHDTGDDDSGASSSDGGGGSPVGADGGTLDKLLFAVVGDTRPPTIDDTAGYPTAIIDKIFSDIAALNPQPAFVLGTGDYQYSSTFATTAATQMDIYLAARSKFAGPFFPVMGNHECTGLTASNCGDGNPDGKTQNYLAYLSKMLGPVGKTQPYYSVRFAASDGSWTAKFLFVAANAWTSDQASWLDGAMGEATTYTFVVRHEPAIDTKAPGVTPSEAIMAKHPYTLAVVGHTHTFRKSGAREVIIGNGGAPISGGVNYGFGLMQQRSDGAIQVDMIDYQTGQTNGMRFAVKPDGSPAS